MSDTIDVSNAERDAVMPDWVRRSEACSRYWRIDLSARVNMASTDRIDGKEERDHVRAQIRRQLEHRYENWLNQ